MISASDRENAIQLIDEAVASGSRLSPACQELGITERTYYRWERQQHQQVDYMTNYFLDRYGAIRDIDFSDLFAEVIRGDRDE